MSAAVRVANPDSSFAETAIGSSAHGVPPPKLSAPPETGPKKRFHWDLAGARLKKCVWLILTMIPVGTVYVVIVSDGFRQLITPSGIRFSAIPFMSFFGKYKATERLDIAYILALGLMLAVWYFWDKLLQYWLDGEKFISSSGWERPDQYKKFILIMGIGLIAADAVFFMTAVSRRGWKRANFSASALIATIAYVGVVIFLSFVSVNINKTIRQLKHKEN